MNTRFIALLFTALFFGSARAGELWCSGTVQTVSFHADNTYMIQLSSMNTRVFFCRPDATFTVPGITYSTAPETCRAHIAVFLTAKESGKTISILFDGNDVPASCTGWANWNSAHIRHFLY